jgi:hypothetical protein
MGLFGENNFTARITVVLIRSKTIHAERELKIKRGKVI